MFYSWIFWRVFFLSIETIYHVDNISTICKYNTFFSQSFVFVSAEWITVRHCLMQKAEEINTFSWKHNDRKQRWVIKKLQTETASLYLYFLIICAQYKQWLLRHFPPKKLSSVYEILFASWYKIIVYTIHLGLTIDFYVVKTVFIGFTFRLLKDRLVFFLFKSILFFCEKIKH